jgi:hypothetical protein
VSTDLQKHRARRRTLRHTLVVAFAVAFYLALVPVAVVLSGPVYSALRCAFGDCHPDGTQVVFALPSRGALRQGSAIRLPNGESVGSILGFQPTGDERYTHVVGLLEPGAERLLDGPLFCQATANFNLQMDAALVVSQCPGLSGPSVTSAPGGARVCGTVDHFERMGQALREFVLENVRPGEGGRSAQLTGPCGADNAEATARLRALLGGS